MTNEERFNQNMINEFHQICALVESKGNIIIHKQQMLKTLTQNTGHWTKDVDNTRRWDRIRFYCSKCGDWQTYGETKFCMNCGEKMEKQDITEKKGGLLSVN